MWVGNPLCCWEQPGPAILRLLQELHFTDAPWAVSRLPQVLPPASSRRSHPSPRAAESGDKEGSPDLSPGLSPDGRCAWKHPRFPGDPAGQAPRSGRGACL